MTSASWAPDVHTFCPLTTKWSPSRTARGSQAGQVGAGSGLAHAQRGGHLGAQDRHRPPLLLLLGAERQQRRGDDPDALRVEGVVDPPARQFLLVDELLEQRALRPPNSGGLPGSSQPASNCSRCQRRAHSGTCDVDRDRSAGLRLSWAGVSSRNRTNSARNASTLGVEGELHACTNISST